MSCQLEPLAGRTKLGESLGVKAWNDRADLGQSALEVRRLGQLLNRRARVSGATTPTMAARVHGEVAAVRSGEAGLAPAAEKGHHRERDPRNL